ncbi:MAG TPA: CocE/NonD family hydrolase, partial [Nonomuraea sp.]|nr:CocE/NonD family hydrolase [Nonomuraea sp.]
EYGDGTRDVEQMARKGYFATHYVDAHRYDWEPDWNIRPLRALFERFFDDAGIRSANFDAEFDGAPFVPAPLKALLESPPVPILYTIGWFDICAVWAWHDVRALSRHPAWAEHLHLRVEAIDHENHWLGHAPIAPDDDHRTDPGALERLLPRYVDPAIEFFDAVLGRRGALPPRVRYELCHGEWRDSATWPPPGAGRLEYHLTPGVLSTEAAPRETRLEWTHDPAELVPSAGADPFAVLRDRPDVAPIGERDDVLRFSGPVAGHDTDLTGAVILSLRLTAPAGANIHTRLLDVTPDARAYLITHGQAQLELDVRGRHVVIDLHSIAYRLRAGHRLALDVMSSDFPHYVPEAPAGGDPWHSLPGEPATREIIVGGPDASRLRIGDWHIDDLRPSSAEPRTA